MNTPMHSAQHQDTKEDSAASTDAQQQQQQQQHCSETSLSPDADADADQGPLHPAEQAQGTSGGGAQGYESLRDTLADDPHPATTPPSSEPHSASRAAAWQSLTRMGSDQSTQDEFELDPVNDRTGLTVHPPISNNSGSGTSTSTSRPAMLSLQESQENLLSADDASFLNTTHHLQPPEASPRRKKGFHNSPSVASGASSGRLGSSQSSAPSSRFASMKQVLGRASTRVINSDSSSMRSQPPVPEIASIYSSQSTDEALHQQPNDQQDAQGQEARTNTENLESGGTRTSTAQPSENLALADPQQPITVDPQWVEPQWTEPPPLEGKSLFILGPDNALRKKLNQFLNQTWVELFLLLLLVLNLVFLIITVSIEPGSDTVWGSHWTNHGLFIIFVLYTLEIGARIIVSGLVLYPKDGDRIRKWLGKKPRTDNLHDTNPTILRKARTMAPATAIKQPELSNPLHIGAATRATTIIDFAMGRQTNMTQYLPTYLDPLIAYRPQFVAARAQIPFLRHTFNRIDMLAVVCFWIDFVLMLMGVQHIYFFKAIAAMRTLRLLNITSGSSTILHSLKKSAPLLVNIALFIAFFFFIFSIIGVHAFKGSFSRRCVSAANETEVLDQFCGGHYNPLDPTETISYITISGAPSPTSPKGHICSHGYLCKDTGVNFHNTVSFDVIYSAMVPVYVLMTGQTWTDMMYRIMDAEYSWSSIYFVLVVLVMNFWILNLFVAVINEMFAKIRDDSANNSAFTSDSTENRNTILNESINHFTYSANTLFSRRRKWLESLEFIWVVAVVVDLVFQCMPQYTTPPATVALYDRIELWFTLAFAFDIVLRFLVWLPTPKEFFMSKKNCVDLFLAVMTLIIQIPAIHRSRVYVYLTVFQVVRVYRPIIYAERLKSLIQRVVGSWIGLLNLIFFIAMFLGVVSVMAGVLFREIIDPSSTSMNFSDFYVSYLGMYQLFSGENWTDILYSVMSAEIPWGQVIIATVFIIAFYSFANFVLVNMLIAIIMENFEGEAEVAKHAQQIMDFAAKSGYSKEEERKFVIYLTKYLKPHPKSIGVNNIQSGWILRMRKGLARQFLLGDNELFHSKEQDPLLDDSKRKKKQQQHHHRRDSSLKSLDFGEFAPRYGPLNQDEIDEAEDFRKLFLANIPENENTKEALDGIKKPKPVFSAEAFRHRSLFIFGPENSFRRLLQRFVTPGRGYRIDGERENVMLSRPFNLFITMAILACVIVAVITTPVWRLHQAELAPEDRSVVIRISDFVFPAVFTVEFFIRVIADGFIFTPDAYLKTLWNQIDFFVLLSLYAPLLANLTNSQGSSRFFRSLKALRALRLINQSAYIKSTFHAVLVAGFPQLFDAAMLSMALVVPFAIYGMRIFAGLFFSCNDSSDAIRTIDDCIGTFVDPETDLLMPRVWSNPQVYSFDNFGASFLILFEILSQEGWSGVMGTARNIVGMGLQPRQDASRYYGIFFVLFNLSGGYFVTSLFVAIVIENYTKRTGTAFMTANQRRWMDLKKLLGSIKMRKAKTTPPANPVGALCFRLASPKRGWFPRLIAGVTVLDGILLATEHVNSGDWEGIKNWMFLALLSVYMLEIFVKIAGLGWRAYRKNKWNTYNSTVSIFALLITVARLGGSSWQPLIQTQKLFLTAILFRLVPQSDSLNQLFMTMAASIGSISSLLGVWLVVFAVFGIMFMEIFGLTAYGSNESDHVNFRNVGNSLLMMARMSTGEGWNDLMHNFAVEKPNCVNEPNDYLLSDCGSTAWAYTLFISFNIISMYIFTNMFIVVVMHNFSYVYQIAPGFSLITREEIRSFKRVWSEVDTEHSGYIREEDLAKFLGKLRGVFDMRIYNEEHSLTKLQSRLETAKPNVVKLSARDLEKEAAAAGLNTQRRILRLNQTANRRATMAWDDEKSGSAGTPTLYNSRTFASQQSPPQRPYPVPVTSPTIGYPAAPFHSLSGPISASVSTPPQQDYHEPTQPNLAYKVDQDYNLAAFNSAIANLDRADVRRRRRVYNFLYIEAVMSMEPIPGSEHRRKQRFFHWRSASRGSHGGHVAAAVGRIGNMGGHARATSLGAGVGHGRSPGVTTSTATATAGDYEMAEMGGEEGRYGNDQDKPQVGISFQKMLHILAHYKLIEDDQCLSMGDMLRHRQKMDRIHAKVNVINVKSILLRMILRQRFLKHYEAVQSIRARTDGGTGGNETHGGGEGGGEGGAVSEETIGGVATATVAAHGSVGSAAAVGLGSEGMQQQQQIPTISRSTYSEAAGTQAGAMDTSGGSSSISSTRPQRRVRMNTEDSQGHDSGAARPAIVRSSRASFMSEARLSMLESNEPIDPEQAEIMIDSLRSEWRTFIDDHNLTIGSTSEGIEIEIPQEPTLADFENAGDLTTTPPFRNEVLGQDYL